MVNVCFSFVGVLNGIRLIRRGSIETAAISRNSKGWVVRCELRNRRIL